MEAGIQAIFHAEVGHAGALRVGLFSHILRKLLLNAHHPSDDFVILCELSHTLEADTLQQQHGILAAFFPQVGVEALEQIAGFGIPSPPEIMCQFIEERQLFGQTALYGNFFPVRSV